MLSADTIRKLGTLYKLLEDAMGNGVNQADLDNASRYPVRQVAMKIAVAHSCHKMTPRLEALCTYVLASVSEEDIEQSFSLKAIPLKDQGFFMIGYMDRDYENFGYSRHKIHECRKAAGLTIRGLAEKAGIAPTTIQNIENGKTFPHLDTIGKIADACGVSISDF